jgi:hypothetical protein
LSLRFDILRTRCIAGKLSALLQRSAAYHLRLAKELKLIKPEDHVELTGACDGVVTALIQELNADG